jgi:hypothetical protein
MNHFSEINFKELSDQFILKTTHDSSGTTICKEKVVFDYKATRLKLEGALKQNMFYLAKEWPYLKIPPHFITEKFLDDHSGKPLQDYTFWCFNGIPKVMYCTNKGGKIFENFYDMNFKFFDINHGFDHRVPEFEKPAEFELMKELAIKLSYGISHVRVDFFDVDGHVYFGEFTFYDWGGMRPFIDRKWDERIGIWMELPYFTQ